MSFAPPFIQEICQYLADNTGGHFTFGDGDTNLKVGELTRGTSGVFAVADQVAPPETVNPVEYHQISFWSINPSSNIGYVDLQYVHDLFHGALAFTTNNYQVYASEALVQIEDLDRDIEGRKIWRLPVYFVARNLIS